MVVALSFLLYFWRLHLNRRSQSISFTLIRRLEDKSEPLPLPRLICGARHGGILLSLGLTLQPPAVAMFSSSFINSHTSNGLDLPTLQLIHSAKIKKPFTVPRLRHARHVPLPLGNEWLSFGFDFDSTFLSDRSFSCPRASNRFKVKERSFR